MKIVIAPDSFKESLDAMSVADAIQRGFCQELPNAEYVKVPLADGGEGTVEALLQALTGDKQYSKATDALGNEVTVMWAILKDKMGKTALIEVAAASGIDIIAPEKRNIRDASTYGTGIVIKEALDQGVDKIILGLGGSATNDGGAGILQALGGRLLDDSGNDLPVGGIALKDLKAIDLSNLHHRCSEVELILACDVDNPLCGKNGASYIFGPQKGANKDDLQALDLALKQFAKCGESVNGINALTVSGFGAAGGTPMGLSLAFDIQIKAGIEMVLDTLDFDLILDNADLVITGEGQMDDQTLQGKAPYGVAKRAQDKGIPVIGIAGSLGKDVKALYSSIDCVFDTVRSPQPLPQVLEEAELNLVRTARNIAATLKLGKQVL
ncbi:glycerate kinase [Vibrio cortegadensis]|uniref:glycerate kinase n=1 Tax=Vibrio cortegadensis TaxID=1328770 RepID=UPI0021C38B7D|nr:glycerate kinase [Vibrio cortegadensis]MDN3699306.1 glycerate kinase [Vibrio cortegadensis]